MTRGVGVVAVVGHRRETWWREACPDRLRRGVGAVPIAVGVAEEACLDALVHRAVAVLIDRVAFLGFRGVHVATGVVAVEPTRAAVAASRVDVPICVAVAFSERVRVAILVDSLGVTHLRVAGIATRVGVVAVRPAGRAQGAVAIAVDRAVDLAASIHLFAGLGAGWLSGDASARVGARLFGRATLGAAAEEAVVADGVVRAETTVAVASSVGGVVVAAAEEADEEQSRRDPQRLTHNALDSPSSCSPRCIDTSPDIACRPSR